MEDFIPAICWIALKSTLLIWGLLVVVSYVIYADRKIWAAIQLRRGPNVVGPWGLLQPFADLLKFIMKEPMIPEKADRVLFILAPLLTATLAFASWAVIPIDQDWVIADINVGVLYVLAISSLTVYGTIIAGWASNSKYAIISSLRAAAQMISYELSIGFILVTVLMCAGSLNLTDIVISQQTGLANSIGVPQLSIINWHFVPLFPVFVIFFISALAETNRPPFDTVEAESELVAGFMVEYGSTPYMLFMLGEYLSICMICALTTILFLGGWLPPIDMLPFTLIPGVFWFFFKSVSLFFIFAVLKACVPRYRYDQLMRLGCKFFLPISIVYLTLVAFVLKLQASGVL